MNLSWPRSLVHYTILSVNAHVAVLRNWVAVPLCQCGPVTVSPSASRHEQHCRDRTSLIDGAEHVNLKLAVSPFTNSYSLFYNNVTHVNLQLVWPEKNCAAGPMALESSAVEPIDATIFSVRVF